MEVNNMKHIATTIEDELYLKIIKVKQKDTWTVFLTKAVECMGNDVRRKI